MATPIRKLNQTGKPYDQPDLESVRDRLPIFTANEPEDIVDAFETALGSLYESSYSVSVQQAAQAFVTKIKLILPLTTDNNKQAFLLEKFCWLLIRIAQQLPSRNVGQELLVSTVKLISVSAEGTWREGCLTALAMNMRDGWSGEFELSICPMPSCS